VRLWADQGNLGLQIQDRGVGFDPQTALDAGITGGLSGMHERAVLLGGQLTIESTPGDGARLTAEFPLAASPPALTGPQGAADVQERWGVIRERLSITKKRQSAIDEWISTIEE